MGLLNTPGYLLEHTASIMHRQSDQVLQERLGIGLSQLKLLVVLQDRPSIQQRALAATLGQTEASISRQIKLLVAKGMLRIETNPQNRREHRAKLTAKGIKLGRAAQEALTEYQAPAFNQLNEKERQLFAEMLHKIHAHTCQPGKPFACDQPTGNIA